ncbi:LPS export ABC transporter periplasmic protein LptC [Colwellia sp. 4_MG-2023]|jgi:lipopolysaccharide export system protein LptC|uniref:LPS export ABC transporter periplasmic protein LptC n=1 Tax=unclassified Colwellia TaxID=196834 RepID=UPI001C096127|nr:MULTISPECIES: LPS export ABC transporter periplasmic protein LptC [unclassified Colwellia]MBU2925015.1 LPS export ABC transporter periplasmic protein LptC [Colwellia sp. C2M11]MDO6486420.1 LPS export ABC transporter periplasmic protein LptC [Colwellia sp. 6_MG-2023]MDO6506298.1 LPS export ABC transporter periplasmic protein LptC [Colwellia sp. 5_MG-2023]MDO6555122.1 LPS export ABC transporter periplasmic protein LptC [Colwellia sp. 4_MG-2023]MDO6651692.1 LPS export ABC transporter periplasm
MTRINFLAFLILLLAATVYGIIEWRQSKIIPGEVIDSELTPDFIAEALKTDIYTDSGVLSHAIIAKRMEHYAKLELTHFELPKYTLYPQASSKDNIDGSDLANENSSSNKLTKNAPWKLSAKEATLYKNNRVILNHRVHLSATDKNSLIQEIHCKYLELDLNTNIISSDQTVMVQGKDFTMYGSGLIIDLNTKQMTLTEHVRTIYKKNNGYPLNDN